MKLVMQKRARITGTRWIALFGILLCSSGLIGGAQTVPYITLDRVDGVALLAPPPAAASDEQKADLDLVRSVMKSRTPQTVALANKDSSLAFALFAPAAGPKFRLDRLPKTKALLEKVKAEIGPLINAPKNHWMRKRPYELDPSLALGEPEQSSSYPSGHSARGTVYAIIIAELFPEGKEPILQMGRQIGWDRVVIAKHFLTDVRAGRVLGQAIFRTLMESPEFQKDLRGAKGEIAAFNP